EQSDDSDVFGYHFEAGSLAVNQFHVRAGKIVDRREFFWDELPDLLETSAAESSDEQHTPGALEPVLSSPKACPEPVEGDPDSGTWETTKADPGTQALKGHDFSRAENAPTNDGAGSDGLQPIHSSPEGKSESMFHAGSVFSALLKQLYIDQHYVPRAILVPVEFDDRETLANLLTARTGHRIEIAVPQRGEKRSLVDLAGQNAKQSYTQRFRVLEPSRKAIQEALADVLMLPELPRRIECFDISHIQGAETVASMVVWEDGKMNKQLYRKFKVMTVLGVDDFASMREVVTRRYRRLLDENGEADALKGHDFSRAENTSENEAALAPEGKPSKEPKTLPSLILIDGGLGQLHAAAEALESLGLTNQPLASIAKREEVIYLYGNEDEPVVLDRRSPVLHLVQLIRDESHRFAVGYHRQRRAMRDRDSELLNIPGVGPLTRQRLLTHFGSLRDIQQATAESLAAVVPRKTAETIYNHFHRSQPTSTPSPGNHGQA
ncbi:MAG: helix-hairpin-helix domain-containing protein, partial [Terracidiphilus sp.]